MAVSTFSIPRFVNTLRTTKRWWIPLGVGVVLALNGLGLLLPRKYKAQAIVAIHETKMEQLTGAASGIIKIEDRLDTIREEMTSFAFLQLVVAKLNLDAGLAPDSPQYERMIKRMAEQIELRVKEKSLFTLAYTAETPRKAADITQTIIDLYIQHSNSFFERRIRTNEAMLTAQLEGARRDLDQALAAVMKYKNEHLKEIPDAQDEHLKQISLAKIDLHNAESQLASLRDNQAFALQKLAKMDRELKAGNTPLESEAMRQLKSQRQTAELKLNTLLQNFKDSHWQVKDVRTELAEIDKQIERQKQDEVQEIVSEPNQAYLDLQEQVEQYKRTEQKLINDITAQQKIIQTIEIYLTNIPRHQVELDRLENVRERAEERVDMLMKRLDEARITRAIGKEGLGPSFDVRDRPRVPQVPSSPNRKKIAALSVAAGGAAAMALVYLLTLLDGTVRSAGELKGVLQMPVLGMMQCVRTAAEELRLRQRRRRRLLGWGAGMVLLLVVAVAGVLAKYGAAQSVEALRGLLNR